MSVIFTILFIVFFWWALIAGAKQVMRRLFGFFAGMWTGGRSFDEQRYYSSAADTVRAPNLESVTREMEATLERERNGAADLLAQSADRHALLKDAEKSIASWDEKARTAIASNRDDLARAALTERFKATEWADGLRDEIGRIDDLLRGYQVDIRGLQTRLGEVYRRRSMADARIQRANTGVDAYALLKGDKWEQAAPGLDSLDRNADFAEARLEAMSLGSAPSTFGRRAPAAALSPSPAQARLLEPLSRSAPSAIDTELAAMKARLAGQA